MKEKLLLLIDIILSPLRLIGKTYDIIGKISIPINIYLNKKFNWGCYGDDRTFFVFILALVSLVLGFLVHPYFLIIFASIFISFVLGGFEYVIGLILIFVALWLLVIFGLSFLSFLSTFWELINQPFS